MVLIGLSMISIITVILSFGFVKVAERQSESTSKNFLQTVATCQDFNVFLSTLDTNVLVSTGLPRIGGYGLADIEVLDLDNPEKIRIKKKRFIVVAGGWGGDGLLDYLDSVEILPLPLATAPHIANRTYGATGALVNKDNGNGSIGMFYQPTEAGPHNLDVRNNGEHVQGSPYKLHISATDEGKVYAYGVA